MPLLVSAVYCPKSITVLQFRQASLAHIEADVEIVRS